MLASCICQMPLFDLPEEILFAVLKLVVLPLDPRLSLPEPQSLLTCRTFHRIGLPILYQSILLRSVPQAVKVERTILSQPKLVCHIRHLYAPAPISWLPVFHAIGHAKGSLQTFDFVFHASLGGNQFLGNGENLWSPLSAVPVRHLVVRQGTVFLHDRTLVAASILARAVEGWTSLVRAFAVRMSFLPRLTYPPFPPKKQKNKQKLRKSSMLNPAFCSYLRLTANHPPSRWHFPARLRCAFYALRCLPHGTHHCSLPARILPWCASC